MYLWRRSLLLIYLVSWRQVSKGGVLLFTGMKFWQQR